MSTTLDPTIAPVAREAAARLVEVIRDPNPGAVADVGHLPVADAIALVDDLTVGNPVETGDTLTYALRDALVDLIDNLDPLGHPDEVEATALRIATLAAEISRVEEVTR